MRHPSPSTLACAMVAGLLGAVSAPGAWAQDLAPRAYVITPARSNAVTLGFSYNDGDLLFQGIVPVTGATGKLGAPSLTYYRGFSLFGRSANVLAALPYGVGTFEGEVMGEERSTDRSGLFDAVFRVSVNLVGGPSMSPAEMRGWRQKTLLGVSLKVTAPTGQYDSSRLINLGTNRWAFKPELGFSRAWGHWVLDAYAGLWLFTENPDFFSPDELVSGTLSQTQDPVGVVEAHLVYDIRPRLWVSLDANFWYGGRTSLNGVENPDTLQESSRVGGTASFPVTRHQSLKVSYAQGAYIRFGGDFRIFSAAWQYSWVGGSN